jgi:hypothetical protein
MAAYGAELISVPPVRNVEPEECSMLASDAYIPSVSPRCHGTQACRMALTAGSRCAACRNETPLLGTAQGKMEMARDLAAEMAARGEGVVLDQFGNADNPLAHFRGTGADCKASSVRMPAFHSRGVTASASASCCKPECNSHMVHSMHETFWCRELFSAVSVQVRSCGSRPRGASPTSSAACAPCPSSRPVTCGTLMRCWDILSQPAVHLSRLETCEFPSGCNLGAGGPRAPSWASRGTSRGGTPTCASWGCSRQRAPP